MLLCLQAWGTPAAAEPDAPQRLTVLGRDLQLYGAGLRSLAWIELYHCALYLPAGAEPPQDAAPDGPIAFRVVVLMQDDDDDLPDEWREAMADEVSPQIISRMRKTYRRAEPGDVVVVAYVPGKGTKTTLNGETLLHTSDSALIEAVTAQWLGRDPVSQDLRRALLARDGGSRDPEDKASMGTKSGGR